MVSTVDCGDAVRNVSAGYAQLRVVGCLVNEVRSLKDNSVSGHAKHVGVADSQVTKLNGDVNFSRDAIFSDVREVNERGKESSQLY